MSNPFYTIGHSTHSVQQLVDMLRAADADLLVDVRSVPRSRTNPQFNRDTLPSSLAEYGVAYEHLAALGGLRGKRRNQPSPNAFWENQSFRNYADYAMGEAFRSGLEQLRALGQKHTCAIMCSEAVWWRCHRRIIADYLLAAGETVFHIMSPHQIVPATSTPQARPAPDGALVYPAQGDVQPG